MRTTVSSSAFISMGRHGAGGAGAELGIRPEAGRGVGMASGTAPVRGRRGVPGRALILVALVGATLVSPRVVRHGGTIERRRKRRPHKDLGVDRRAVTGPVSPRTVR